MERNSVQRILKSLILLFLGIVAGYYLATNQVEFSWKNYKPRLIIENKNPPKDVKIDLYLFWDVWERLQKNYVDKKAFDPQKMLYGAISGMVEALDDPYTVFLSPEKNTEIKQELAGQFEGIGAELGVREKKIVVIAPLNASPAQKAGVRSGDVILKVDGGETTNWTLPEAVSKIRGPKGTTVVLTVWREGEEKSLEIPIVRETIRVKSVEGQMKYVETRNSKLEVRNEKCERCFKIAYIKLSRFGDETNNEWLIIVNNLADLIREDPQKTKGLVLDMRNNSGGYLNSAVFVASEFIKDGTVVIQEKGAADNNTRQSFPVNRKGLLTEIPIVVLINRGSASASEIVAAALRDNKRAKLMGENSFGKGTIQEAQELGGGAGLHITVAKWLTPAGIWVNGKGLEPDLKVENDSKDSIRDLQLEKALEVLVK